MSTQTIRYAVGQIAFLMKGPGDETLDIPVRHFGKPCVVTERGVIRMLWDGPEWAVSRQKHLMLAFPVVGDKVAHAGKVFTVDAIDRGDMWIGCGYMTTGPRPLRLTDGRGYYCWPRFKDICLLSGEHNPDMALLPEEDADKPSLAFKVGDKVQTPYGLGVVDRVDAEDTEDLPYRVRHDYDGVSLWVSAGAVTPQEPEKHTLTLEFDSADDLAIARGILGNLDIHSSVDLNAAPALARVLQTLQDVAPARGNVWWALGTAEVYLRAGWHEKDGTLCAK